MIIFDNRTTVITAGPAGGNYREEIKGYALYEDSQTGAVFVIKEKSTPKEPGGKKTRTYILPEESSPEEYVLLEKALGESAERLKNLLKIKKSICGTKKDKKLIEKAALDFYKTPKGYMTSVAMNWSRKQFVSFVLREEKVAQ